MFTIPALPQQLKTDTEKSLPALEERYRSAMGIVPFVGAGISKQFHLPTWAEFLIIQANDVIPPQTDRILHLLDKEQFEEAADELAADRLNAFKQTLEDEFGDTNLEDPAKGYPGTLTSGAAGLIPFITKGPVITTNFDHVLEKVFEHRGRKFEHILLPIQHGLAAQAFLDNRTYLIKLHGDVDDPNTQIITRTDYEKYYVEQKDLPELLARTFRQTPLLFIGCSLQNDRIFKVLEEVVESPSYTRHFAILEAPADIKDSLSKRERLRKCNINLIWYPHGQHEWVARYLEQIVKSRIALDRIYGPEREIAIVYSHLTLAPEIKRFIEERKPTNRQSAGADTISGRGQAPAEEKTPEEKERDRLASLQTYFLVPGDKDGNPEKPEEGQQKCRGTKVACVCETRSAAYLSSAFARIDYLAYPLRVAIRAGHELESDPHNTCIYLGVISNPPAWTILNENPLVTLRGLVPDTPSNLYFSLKDSDTPLHVNRGEKDGDGNRLIDYGIILRFFSPQSQPNRRIVCAGLGEFATSGAAYYLANKFQEIVLTSSEAHFVCLVQVMGTDDKNPKLIGQAFELPYNQKPGSDLLSWQNETFDRSKSIV